MKRAEVNVDQEICSAKIGVDYLPEAAALNNFNRGQGRC